MLIIFDMDGLMFDTERIYYKGWTSALKEHHYEMTWDLYTQIVARNSRYIEKVLKKNLGEAFPYDSVYKRKSLICDDIILKEGLIKKEGLIELLDYLEKHHIQKVVATSSMREKTIRYLELAQLSNRFDGIICGSDLEESKPNPEIFLKAAQLVNAKSNDCLVLEDSRLGLQAAKAAGMKCALIPDLIQPNEEMKENATYILKSLNEVIPILEKQTKS